MFEQGQALAYGASGICRYDGTIRQKSGNRFVSYYVLKPVYNQGSTVYVPVDNEKLVARIRPLLSQREILDMIHGLPQAEELRVEDEGERQSVYREILQTGDRRKILQVIKSLHLRQSRCRQAGRKFHAVDERLLKDAEAVLHEEFAFVLGLPREQVQPFILREMQC